MPIPVRAPFEIDDVVPTSAGGRLRGVGESAQNLGTLIAANQLAGQVLPRQISGGGAAPNPNPATIGVPPVQPAPKPARSARRR